MKVENKNPQKPLVFYYLIAMIVLMLLNALVFPSLMAPHVQEVGYSDFLNMIEQKKVEEVAMDVEQIIFTAKNEAGESSIYKTGLWLDDNLVDRLYESGARFTAAIPTQDSPMLSFITGWVFPLLFFVLIGQLLGRMMAKRMGGNAMQFGMVALETVNNPYLGADTSLACSQDTSARVDAEVQQTIEAAHDRAVKILTENRELLDKPSAYLLEKETIIGTEFMEIMEKEA